MKKVISFLVTILITCTMLSTFVLPAFAESQSVGYNDREYKNNEVVTIAKTVDATLITSDMEAWGTEGADSWYVVNSDVTLSGRPIVLGNVNLILADGKTLTAGHGITLETGNSLTVYAQSNDEETMGQLKVTVTNGDAGIGGRAGEDGTQEDKKGKEGKAAGTFCQKGGKITVNAGSSTCIGGGNGGNGKSAETYDEPGAKGGKGGSGGPALFYDGITVLTGEVGIGGGHGGIAGYSCYGTPGWGGDGGFWLDVIVYGGNISISSSEGICIGGGNGGNGGRVEDHTGGYGGAGGGYADDKGFVRTSFSSISFLGGTVEARSLTTFCFGCGKGGEGGIGSESVGPHGKNGRPTKITTGDGAEIIAGDDSGSAEAVSEYIEQKYVKVSYPQADDSISTTASIISAGYPWTVIAICVLAVGGVVVVFIVKKKKKLTLAGDAENTEEE